MTSRPSPSLLMLLGLLSDDGPRPPAARICSAASASETQPRFLRWIRPSPRERTTG